MEESLSSERHSAAVSEDGTSSTSSSTLPQELVDQIIDHLHNDVQSLRSCSTVCRAWLPSSRLHLFSKIRLDIPERQFAEYNVHADRGTPHKACQRLYGLLLKDPSIIPHIHDLVLVSGSPLGPLAVQDGHYRHLWIVEGTLPLLLRMLTHLKRFEITSPQGNVPWHAIPSPLLDAFKALGEGLKYIRVKAWDFPRLEAFEKLLRHLPKLKGLALWSNRLGQGGADTGDEARLETKLDILDAEDSLIDEGHHDVPRLEFLILDYVECAYFGDWLLSRPRLVDLSGLRELRIAHSYDKSVQRLLRAVGNSLERFHFKPGPVGLQRLDLSYNISLRCIWLTLEEDVGVLSWIAGLLSTLPNPSTLERIALELYTDPKRLNMEDWRTVRKVLSEAPGANVNLGIFASPNSVEFLRVKEEMSAVNESEPTTQVRVYQLGTKRQGSICAGMIPVIEKFEDDFGRRTSGSGGHH
ncbi:hypothetical protein Moror_1265 [Moniliophthora roreri MCA 2997]|uniref:F-box domain-containing protein n=2 Tax=Moniliophthora roreri TaxID=221103 RepID=V2WPI8_MONRO|nr:hypothetical protein Moror_1265 [Moniliophthora roreri MCA 2997]KAI3602796.1 hypothetical protein WG66_008072 [Moniliophthora roreri]